MPRAIGPDLDLRAIRYFVAVAEAGSLGRAAETLRVAQPSLGRQIASLEDQLGVLLFERLATGVTPTTTARELLPLARRMLNDAAETVAEVRSTRAMTSLVLGYATGLLVTDVVKAFRETAPSIPLETQHVLWNEPAPALTDGRVDAVVARLPFRTDGFSFVTLGFEPRVLVVPIGHELAERDHVTIDDLADAPMPRLGDPVHDAFWRIDPRPDGSRAPDGPAVSSMEDALEVIVAGDALGLGPGALGRGHRTCRDFATVPLEGIEPTEVVIAWRRDDDRPGLAELVELTREAHVHLL